ncbi:MAG TPA: FtsQ-type POTRA domain-containing protein [Spirochaetota bacterium]|nr:FtsQ-type POTRA domain-containing protein [Spirochaetota bacterium]HOL56652.1 FtsQ-type POTRA domain-containing protein [Spirochaetota bacterium]HPP04199.1 FtsQ-type POTRA domain-containing protein [Spirochaetota bacterium]
MKIKYVVAFALVISVILSFILIFVAKDFFIVKNIVIDKDFSLNNEKFIRYLDIQPDKYVWEYNISDMENRLARQAFLDQYKVNIRYPDTLVIFLRIRKPVAKLIINNKIMFIDKNCVIFSESEDSDNLPLLNFDIKQNLDYGKILEKKYSKIIDILLDLKNKNSNIYRNIESIDISEKKPNLIYFVKYYGNNENIYLKNFINVDLLKKGFVLSLYLKENDIKSSTPYYAGLGFVY